MNPRQLAALLLVTREAAKGWRALIAEVGGVVRDALRETGRAYAETWRHYL